MYMSRILAQGVAFMMWRLKILFLKTSANANKKRGSRMDAFGVMSYGGRAL